MAGLRSKLSTPYLPLLQYPTVAATPQITDTNQGSSASLHAAIARSPFLLAITYSHFENIRAYANRSAPAPANAKCTIKTTNASMHAR
eukprot:6179816-Pleurochrysis_carterae.AAC.4